MSACRAWKGEPLPFECRINPADGRCLWCGRDMRLEWGRDAKVQGANDRCDVAVTEAADATARARRWVVAQDGRRNPSDAVLELAEAIDKLASAIRELREVNRAFQRELILLRAPGGRRP